MLFEKLRDRTFGITKKFFYAGEKAKNVEAQSRELSFQQASAGCVQSSFELRALRAALDQGRSAFSQVLAQNLGFSLCRLVSRSARMEIQNLGGFTNLARGTKLDLSGNSLGAWL